jgi:hypothetical protein
MMVVSKRGTALVDATWMPDEPAHREIPRPVAIAFWLWGPVIVFQTLLVLWNVIGTAQTNPSGLGVSLTLNLLTLAIVAVAALLLFRLRRGSRSARGWLLGIAIFWVAIAVYQALAVASHVVIGAPGSSGWWIVVVAVVNVVVSSVAFVGALIPFLSPTSEYFAKRPGSDGRPAQRAGRS